MLSPYLHVKQVNFALQNVRERGRKVKVKGLRTSSFIVNDALLPFCKDK